MNANEKIYVKSYGCESTEDDFEKGESTEASSTWTSSDSRFRNAPGGYATVEDALKAVCEAESFDWDRSAWISWGEESGEDFGRFDGGFMVDADNCQASASEIEAWKKGEKRLWSCLVTVELEVRAVREMTEDEAKALWADRTIGA